MIGRRNSLRVLLARVGVVAAVVASGLIAGASSASADPSPYCRPSVGTPYVSAGPTYQGNNHYTFTVTVYVSMNCNGSIYSSSVTPLLHYTLDGGADHIVTGSSKTCTSSCEASAHITETFLCTDYNYMSFYGAITGWWKRYSSSSKATLYGTGATYNDAWFDGNGACP